MNGYDKKDALLKVIPSAITLASYINSIITLSLVDHGASDLMIQYLNKIQIVPESNYDTNQNKIDTPNQGEQRSTMNEILSRFIDSQLKNTKDYRQQNCIVLGYRTKSMNSTSIIRSNANLECYHLNTLHNYFNNEFWAFLAYELGENVIKHLLSRPMFLSIENGCYLQLTGTPIFESIRTSNINPLAILAPSQIGNSLIITPSTLIPRQVLFYNCRYDKAPGLPSTHIINKKSSTPLRLAQTIFSPACSSDFQKRTDLGQIILENYRELAPNISQILNNVCPIDYSVCSTDETSPAAITTVGDVNQPTTSQLVMSSIDTTSIGHNSDLIMSNNNSANNKKRKCRRGCRAGASRKKPRPSFPDRNPNTHIKSAGSGLDAASSALTAHTAIATTTNERVQHIKAHDTANVGIILTTVSEHLLTRQVKCAKRNARIDSASQAYNTQDLPDSLLSQQSLESGHNYDPLGEVRDDNDENLKVPNDTQATNSNKSVISDENNGYVAFSHFQLQGNKVECQPSTEPPAPSLTSPLPLVPTSTSLPVNPYSSTTEPPAPSLTSPLPLVPTSTSPPVNPYTSTTPTPTAAGSAIAMDKTQTPTAASFSTDSAGRRRSDTTRSSTTALLSSMEMSAMCEQRGGLYHHSFSRSHMTMATGSSPTQSTPKTPLASPNSPLVSNSPPALIDSIERISDHVDNIAASCNDGHSPYRPEGKEKEEQPFAFLSQFIRPQSSSMGSAVDVATPCFDKDFVPRAPRSRSSRHRHSGHSIVAAIDSNSIAPPGTNSSATTDVRVRKKRKFILPTDGPVNLHQLQVPVHKVSSFVKCICRRVFSIQAVWGTRHNMDKFLAAVEGYIHMGRNDSVTVHQLMSGVRIADLPWLDLASGEEAGEMGATEVHENDGVCGKSRLTERKLQTQCFIEFTYWLYFFFINPLISTCFYVTEGEGCGQRILYYRKPVWSQCMRLGRLQMKQHFVEVQLQPTPTGQLAFQRPICLPNSTANNNSSGNSNTNLGSLPLSTSALSSSSRRTGTHVLHPLHTYPKHPPPMYHRNWSKLQQLAFKRLPSVRYLPKKTSLRPITNLKRHQPTGNNTNSGIDKYSSSNNTDVITNTMLYQCLHVLKHIYQLNPVLGGYGVMGMDEIYAKFKHFKSGLRSKNRVSAEEDKGTNMRTDDMPQLYMATLDLEKCYDNVDTVRLYDIVQELITEYNHNLQRPVSHVDPNLVPGADVTTNVHIETTAKLVRDGAPTATGSYQRKPASTSSPSAAAGAGEEGPDDHVILHKYTVTHYMKSLERPVSRAVRQITCLGDIVPIKESAAELARNYPNSIITDGVVYPQLALAEVLNLIKSHLFNHVVKLPVCPIEALHASGGDETAVRCPNNRADVKVNGFVTYNQIRGIPQGSVLSPILCNLYYGHTEKAVFGRSPTETARLGLQSGDSMIIRLMDDYFLVSSDKEAVVYFLQTAHDAYPHYGGGINPTKTKVNFDCTLTIKGQLVQLPRVQTPYMLWYGMHICTNTLQVTPSFQRLLENPINQSLLIDGWKMGVGLRKAMKCFVRMKCHAIFLDNSINRYSTVVGTVYEMYLMVAVRTLAHLTEMRKRAGYATHTGYICQCIDETVAFGALLIRSRTKKKKSRRLHLGSSSSHSGHITPTTILTPRGRVVKRSIVSHAKLNIAPYSAGSFATGDSADIAHTTALKTFDELMIETSHPRLQAYMRSKCDITSHQVIWLAYTAFKTFFTTKKRFSGVEKWLYRRVCEYERNIQRNKLGQLQGYIDSSDTVRHMLQTVQY